ncbi:MAG: CRISPR-associated endoribonuclease Cas6 [Clostridium sp.]|nr:CRISPR-associated endoribonuclease Cas6 [Clostridium sp.]
MLVFEIKLKVFLLKDIEFNKIQTIISSFIDKCLVKDREFLKFHDKNTFKNYCFDSMFPLCENSLYKSGNVYTITIRTIDKKIADYLSKNLSNEYDENIKGLVSDIRIIPKKHIKKIYSLTPVIAKTEKGYWKGNLTIEEFEKRLKNNVIKKYNMINQNHIDESVELYNLIEFVNKKPIGTIYKNIKLLGDKISLEIADDELSQELAYMILGTGILEMNSRGFGFVNFRYL